MTSRSASAARRGQVQDAPARPRAVARARNDRPSAAARRRQAQGRRRRRVVFGLAGLAGLCALLAASGVFSTAVNQIALPLRHEDIIRQQARDKAVDPALVAGVIYTESHFRDGQTSEAGAEGLMQLTPATAQYIARKSGGIAFRVEDLATPQVNIAYGTYYLRYLLNRYDGSETLALAAYNGGEGNVDRWRAAAKARGEGFGVSSIPFRETREYVGRVESAKRSYRSQYRSELGL